MNEGDCQSPPARSLYEHFASGEFQSKPKEQGCRDQAANHEPSFPHSDSDPTMRQDNGKYKQFHLKLPEDLHRKVKVRAASENKSMNLVISEMLESGFKTFWQRFWE